MFVTVKIGMNEALDIVTKMFIVKPISYVRISAALLQSTINFVDVANLSNQSSLFDELGRRSSMQASTEMR